MTAANWAQKAAEATASNSSIGEGEFMDMFEPQRRLYRRQAFIRSVLRQTMQVGTLCTPANVGRLGIGNDWQHTC